MSTANLIGSDLIINGTRGDDVIEVRAHLDSTQGYFDEVIESRAAAKSSRDVDIVRQSSAVIAAKPILPAPYATVTANGQEIGRFDLSSFESVWIYGHAGNDRLSVSDALYTMVYLDGGAGNDTLFIDPYKVGADVPVRWLVPPRTTSLMLGGDGDDLLVGSDGVDMLIGGLGSDLARGLGGDDLLIGGATFADGDTKSLLALLSVWKSDAEYGDRIDEFRGAVSDLIPFDMDATFAYYDDGVDTLEGGDGQDWFFTGDRAILPDLTRDETVDW
jgi:Ca2+-binding RTX toxin-like protein